jgi:uncharacterized SAM-binding protein YcdF (DUF218 family)
MNNRIISDITNYIFVSDELQKADVILMPGSADPLIPEKAAELYHNGYAPILLPSGGVSVKNGKFSGVKRKVDIYNKDYKTECEFYADVLKKNGVPEEAILWEDKSGHTRDNAFFSRRVADDNKMNVKKAIVCCKSFHARRCLMFYQLAFPDSKIYIVPVDCYGVNRDNWHKQEYGIDRVLGELARCGNQFSGDMKEYLRVATAL